MDNENEIRVRSQEVSPIDDAAKVTNNNTEMLKLPGGFERTFSRLKERGHQCCIPCLRSHNPLPENANFFQRLRAGLLLPPEGNIAYYVQFVFICLQIWVVLFSLTRTDALLNGNLFSLLILFIACVLGGYLISFIRVPSLLGMLIVGVMMRNVPGLKTIGEGIDSKWSGALKKIALTILLTRMGMGLDTGKLRKLSWPILRLAFIPCLAEAITVGIVSHFLMGFPWRWSLMLGFILGGLAPAVTVKDLVNLQERRYGVAKGIPTMCIAAGWLDNITCITGFSVFLGTIFSTGDIAMTTGVLEGPLGVLLGIVYGFVMGFILWYLPSKDCSSNVFYRSLLLLGSGMVAVFGSSEIGLLGAGPLGCLTTAAVAAYKWRQRRKSNESDEIDNVTGLAWLIVQHFLFGLIGAAVNINDIRPSTVGLSVATLVIGLCVRSAISFAVTMRTEHNRKERIFVGLTWMSKGTLQAAIGGMALDRVLEANDPDKEAVRLSLDIITLSVLAIVICAPFGAACMTLLGPRLLSKEELSVSSDGEIDVRVCSGENNSANGRASSYYYFNEENKTKEGHYSRGIDAVSSIGDILVENDQFIESCVHVNQAFSFDENPVSTSKQFTTYIATDEKRKNFSATERNRPTSTDVQVYINTSIAENVSTQDNDNKYYDNEHQINGNLSKANVASLLSFENENENIQWNGHINQSYISFAEIVLSRVRKCEEDTSYIPRKISVTLKNVPTQNNSQPH
ncbi:hypothetical protein ACJMK2_023115 [Sinanodonta woodiana]|uniref:Cation/H+ exchanger transmembrane domain-containing protein n=1 Tax=Sinanodonta woodiana TaxID=1069815 RepID=A0ABD3T375_SINWO